MAQDQYDGIRRALTLAMLTEQSVNVGLIRGGEAVKIEGVIQQVYSSGFLILLEPEPAGAQGNQLGEPDLICVSEVEYVEYS